MAEKRTDPTAKARLASIEECASRMKRSLGEAGTPIAEAILVVGEHVKRGTEEMRGFAAGAKASAADAAKSAAAAADSASKMEADNSVFLTQMEEYGADLKAKAERAEAAVNSLTYGEAKGVDALRAISKEVEEIPTRVANAVTEATSIDVIIPQPDGGQTTEKKSGSDALAYIGEYLAHVSRTAGEALGAANEAKEGVAQLRAVVEDAFTVIDQKLNLMLSIVQQGGKATGDEVEFMEKPSFKGDTDG